MAHWWPFAQFEHHFGRLPNPKDDNIIDAQDINRKPCKLVVRTPFDDAGIVLDSGIINVTKSITAGVTAVQ